MSPPGRSREWVERRAGACRRWGHAMLLTCSSGRGIADACRGRDLAGWLGCRVAGPPGVGGAVSAPGEAAGSSSCGVLMPERSRLSAGCVLQCSYGAQQGSRRGSAWGKPFALPAHPAAIKHPNTPQIRVRGCCGVLRRRPAQAVAPIAPRAQLALHAQHPRPPAPPTTLTRSPTGQQRHARAAEAGSCRQAADAGAGLAPPAAGPGSKPQQHTAPQTARDAS